MISRQTAATWSLFSGPRLAAWILSITCATRSGLKKGVPSRFLTSPTSSATCARLFNSANSSASIASICTRSAARSWVIAVCHSSYVRAEPRLIESIWLYGYVSENSCVTCLKISHVGNQRVNAIYRHGVVNTCAHTAHRFVAFKLKQAA